MRLGAQAVMAGVLAWCVSATPGYAEMSNIKGWGWKAVHYVGTEGNEGTAEGVDIDGEVGHPLDVWGPTAYCSEGPYRDENQTTSIISNRSIVSGSLPPGVIMREDAGYFGAISGIPTERGHWIVTMQASDLCCAPWQGQTTCSGQTYWGFTQQLRFHITGTGKVIE